jgi:hypothetical protein
MMNVTRIPTQMHLHSARTMFGWILGMTAILAPIALATPFGLPAPRGGLVTVTGRVSLNGQPVNTLVICFDSGDDHTAEGWLKADGSFHLHTRGRGDGTVPGTYRVHLFPNPNGPSIPRKYLDPATSGLHVEVGKDWSDFSFDLH